MGGNYWGGGRRDISRWRRSKRRRCPGLNLEPEKPARRHAGVIMSSNVLTADPICSLVGCLPNGCCCYVPRRRRLSKLIINSFEAEGQVSSFFFIQRLSLSFVYPFGNNISLSLFHPCCCLTFVTLLGVVMMTSGRWRGEEDVVLINNVILIVII